ncbi:S1 family peptidase [Arenimonas sp.]|uniref:S1 family peptidase n=1 Tax=Arenimonas sp. TaxID=1872635 RepID=UPI0039E3F2F4
MSLIIRSIGLLLCLVPALAFAGKTKSPAIANSDAALAVYAPPSELSARTYNARYNVWFEPGDALGDAITQVGKPVFPNMVRFEEGKPVNYGLLLDLNPDWDFKEGRLQLTLSYNVFAPDGKKLHEATAVARVPIKGFNLTAAAHSGARQAIASAMADTALKLQPDAIKFPATASTEKFDRELLVDRSKPVRTGTGFFINASGQLLTAAHVQRGCVVLEARKDGKAFRVTPRAASELLDVAVLDSAQATAAALPLRSGEKLVLGESVTSVGYPLQGLLADSPNLTRGNVSSASGMKGSYGMFQFSAPIQPGNSGGPVVSDNGELLGIAVGTLNAKSLVDKGLLPQNVNFALDSTYVAQFLRREHIAFSEVQPKGPGDMKTANDAALGATVQLACFQ